MAENKKSFLLYKSWVKPIEELPDNLAGDLIMRVLEYVNGHPAEYIDPRIEELYDAIVEQIEYEWSKFNPKTEKFHWNYKGGIAPENKAIRSSLEYSYWRTDVFVRDEYTCQHCGQTGGILHAHHIKHFASNPELRFEVSNGITLCKTCHEYEHSKEKQNG